MSWAALVEATLGVARNAEDVATAQPMLEELLNSLTATDSDTRLQRAQVLMALSQVGLTTTRSLDLSRVEEAVTIRSTLLPASHADLLGARQVFAWQLWQAGRGTDAQRQLRARLEAVSAPACDALCAQDNRWLQVSAYLDLGWLLLALDDKTAAGRLVQDYADAVTGVAADSPGQQESLTVFNAWLSDAQGDHAGAARALASLMEARKDRRMGFNELELLTDLACFAERSKDSAAATQWHDKLRERGAELREKHRGFSLSWLRLSKGSPFNWHRVRLDAEIAWLEKHEPSLLQSPTR